MIDEILQRLGGTSAGKMADEALSAVDWEGLHQRSQATFDRVRNGGSLALESGMQQAPPVSAMDRYKQYIPPQQARGPVETIRDAFTPRQDEQGNPKADSLGDIINAALWVVPGARGRIRPEPFQRPPAASNFNRSPEGVARDKIRQELLSGKAAHEAKLKEQFGDPIKLDADSLLEGIRRRAVNSEALANGAQPNATIPARDPFGGGGGIRAYHASPHDFEKFDMSKIGTGLGHAYRGEGMNFTTNEAKALAMREQYFPGGHVYETNLRVAPEELLNFDKPIAEQPHVQRALDSAGVVPGGNLPAFARKNLTGKDALAALENLETPAWRKVLNDPMVSTSQQGARQHLLKSGIPGGVGADQHVIYDAALIDILRKYGIMGGVLGGGAIAATNNEAKAQ